MEKVVLFLIIFANFTFISQSQSIYYQEVCNCGVTGAGFSTNQGAGSGDLQIHIAPGSTIKKAYLFCERFGEGEAVDIIVNGIKYNFNLSNQMSSDYNIPFTGLSGVHAIDLTNEVNPNVNNYQIEIPVQMPPTIPNVFTANWRYGAVFLWVLYENPNLEATNAIIILNEQDVGGDFSFINSYHTSNLNPINNNFPVGFDLYTDRIGGFGGVFDNSLVHFNTNFLGSIGGPDPNCSPYGGGVMGHFYYENKILYGLSDDIPNNLMGGSDGLADVSSYINNNDTNIKYKLTVASGGYNIYCGFFLNYTSPCDTFSTTITSDTIICQGEVGS